MGLKPRTPGPSGTSTHPTRPAVVRRREAERVSVLVADDARHMCNTVSAVERLFVSFVSINFDDCAIDDDEADGDGDGDGDDRAVSDTR